MKALSNTKHSLFVLFQKNIPFLLTLFLIIFSLMPWQITFISYFAVPLAYISLFWWSVFCTDLITPPRVFILGFCCDLLTTAPLGYNTILFLFFYWVVVDNHRFLKGRSFLFLWGCFGVCCLGLAVCQWALASLLFLEWLSLSFFIIQSILLIAMFPFISTLCTLLYLRFLEDA